MNEEIPYASLYEYLGRSTANNSEGLKVIEQAQERGIKLGYKLLPEALQTANYKSVATYPVEFLDSIYKRSDQVLARKDEIQELHDRIRDIESKLNKLISLDIKNKLDTLISPDTEIKEIDDLPF